MSAPMIVAELSANHGGSLQRALDTIREAKQAGADAVKFQTFTPEQMVIDHTYEAKRGHWAGRKLIDLYLEAHTPREWHQDLFDCARDLGLVSFSTAFHRDDIDFLETLDCPIYKIASFEMTDLDLIAYAAGTGKPIIISTGMARQWEIESAFNAAFNAESVTLLKCTSAYPAWISDANLRTMVAFGELFDCRYGLSDHTVGNIVAVSAAALGASVIEKHFSLTPGEGLDGAFSMGPDEFSIMAGRCREAWECRGGIKFGPVDGDSSEFRRTLYAARTIKQGEPLMPDDIVTARPALGINPYRRHEVICHRAGRDIAQGEPLTWDMLT